MLCQSRLAIPARSLEPRSTAMAGPARYVLLNVDLPVTSIQAGAITAATGSWKDPTPMPTDALREVIDYFDEVLAPNNATFFGGLALFRML